MAGNGKKGIPSIKIRTWQTMPLKVGIIATFRRLLSDLSRVSEGFSATERCMPLRSVGITLLHHYYEHVRLPTGHFCLLAFSACQQILLIRRPGRVSQVPTHSIRCRATVLDPGKSAMTLAINEPLRTAFQLNYTVGLPEEPISGLITFTCVAAQHLLSTGSISFVTSADAASVGGCWLSFTCVGLEPTGMCQLSLAHNSPGTIIHNLINKTNNDQSAQQRSTSAS